MIVFCVLLEFSCPCLEFQAQGLCCRQSSSAAHVRDPPLLTRGMGQGGCWSPMLITGVQGYWTSVGTGPAFQVALSAAGGDTLYCRATIKSLCSWQALLLSACPLTTALLRPSAASFWAWELLRVPAPGCLWPVFHIQTSLRASWAISALCQFLIKLAPWCPRQMFERVPGWPTLSGTSWASEHERALVWV